MEKPIGLMKTILWTQLGDAILMDFGIKLPDRAGENVTSVISGVVDLIKWDEVNHDEG